MTKKNVNDQKKEGFKKYLNFLPEYGILIFSIFMLATAVTVVFFPEKTHGYVGWLNHNIHQDMEHQDTNYIFTGIAKVYIKKDGTVFYNPKALSLLQDKRKSGENSHSKDVKVTVIAHPEVPYHKVLSVLDQLKKANLRNIFLTDQENLSVLNIWKEIQDGRRF